MCKIKKSAKLIIAPTFVWHLSFCMAFMAFKLLFGFCKYVLWNNKIQCFIIPVYNILNLLPVCHTKAHAIILLYNRSYIAVIFL